MIKKEEIIKIGKFQKTHALKGELNMISNIDSDYFSYGNPLIIEYDGILVPYYAETIRPKGSSSYLIKISGIDSEDEAAQFVNKEIYILKKDAEDWLQEELIDSNELEGYKIIDSSSNEVVGIVDRVDDTTANLLFIVSTQNGEEIFIPANEDFIVDIDDENKIIIMNLPQGLIDLNKKTI
ncbi:MAG: 16S rRNA processing protein RimM [Muribaculaceae bacterium]|nr:16S rRNA processing protein RimM [Muribaculaceae bacterium]